MKNIVDKQFYSLVDRGDTLLIENIVVERCEFGFCGLCKTIDLKRRTTVRNVHIKDCVVLNHTSVGPAILEDITVENIKTYGLFILWDPLFKHVTLRGNVGQIKINPVAGVDADLKPELQIPFNEAKAKYYQDLDWALDISEARFQVLDMCGVPSHLVRRDTESQVVVTRQKALSQGWREKLHPSNTYWTDILNVFIQDEEPDIILAAPKALPRKKYEKLLDGLKDLREIGLAEPD